MDGVWLASYPRSGVTFFRHVFERMYDIPTWSLYRRENEITGLFSRERVWPEQSDGSLPLYVVKTHLVDTATTPSRAIHIVRDGRDVAVSMSHYARDMLGYTGTSAALLQRICEGDRTMGHWGVHTLVWAGRTMPTAYVVFDDLVRDPISTVRAAVETLGLNLTPNESCCVEDFADLHKLRPTFFRSGIIGQWATEMPYALQRIFEQVHGGALHWFQKLCDERGTTRSVEDSVRVVA
jgi:hypothetical protein